MMEVPLDSSIERHATEVLVSWYEWEMYGVERTHFGGSDAA